MRVWFMAVVLAGVPLTATAQKLDCAATMAQQEMNACEAARFQTADRALNDAYGDAIAFARSVDDDTEALLRQAQRAWVTYRDAACAVEAWMFEGGTAEPMILSGCLARLTDLRTQDLRDFAAQY